MALFVSNKELVGDKRKEFITRTTSLLLFLSSAKNMSEVVTLSLELIAQSHGQHQQLMPSVRLVLLSVKQGWQEY